jgi:hypothetical protein
MAMVLKTIFISLLTFAPIISMSAPGQSRQVRDRLLPEELSESESQLILKEEKPKARVEATLKVSHARIDSAYKLIQESQFRAAAQDVDVYTALIRYADDYTRKLPGSQIKDRNHCLKKIEQAIFKQTRTLDAIVMGISHEYREATERGVAEVKKIRLRAINDLLGGGSMINSSNDQ